MARRAGFEVLSADANGQVSDEGVVGLQPAVGNDDLPVADPDQVDEIEELGERGGLVELDDERVGYTRLDTVLDHCGVADRQVIGSNQMLGAELFRPRRPRRELGLLEWVFDNRDGETFDQGSNLSLRNRPVGGSDVEGEARSC